MAARAYWKGYLKLSLVNIAVELYSATKSSSQIRLNQIHAPSGKRIRYQKIAEGIGPVDTDEIVKGYRIDDDEYVLLDDDELDAIKLESRRTLNLVQFVEQGEIDPRYFEKPYYVVPKDDEVATEGFIVIREALRKAGKTALGQLAVRGRDHLVAIRPCGKGLLAETLRYGDEVRDSESIFDDIPQMKVDKELTELASELIDRKTAPFSADDFSSQYATALRDLIEEKRQQGEISDIDEGEGKSGPSGGNVIDLMEALKKSVEGEKARKSRSSAAKSRRKKSSSGGKSRKSSKAA